MDKSKKILVVYGGPSSEAEVSARTAKAIHGSLIENGFNASLLEFSFNFAEDIKKSAPDVVYNAMHGAFGEDGCLPGLLECLRIPYTHSGVRASAVAMDKALTKNILLQHNVTLAAGKVLTRDEVLAGNITGPCVVKPVADGSSVGVAILKKGEALDTKNLGSNSHFLIEEFVEGRELTVAVLDGKALGVLEIRPKSGVYDYASKYTSGATEYIIPAPVADDITKQAAQFAEIAHKALGCRGVTRSDLIYDENNNKVYFLEVNTHPGMTATSLVPKIAAGAGISFQQVIEKVLATATLEIK